MTRPTTDRMRVLVTGAAGYLGSILSLRLLEAGHRIRGFDNLMHGGQALLGLLGHERFEFVTGDVRNHATLEHAVQGIDAVVHLAAIVGDPACAGDPDTARQVNEEASEALIAASQSAGVERFVFASTCSNYGRMSDTSVLADEGYPLQPLSLYATTKVAVEHALLHGDVRDMAATVLRFATLYGLSPRMRFDLTVNQFVMEMLVHRRVTVFGEQFWRPYVHVRDAADAVVRVLEAPRSTVDGEVLNVGDTRENYRKADLIALMSRHAPDAIVEYVHVAEDPRDYKVSFDRIRERLGFIPTRTVADGMAEIGSAIANGAIGNPDSPAYYNHRAAHPSPASEVICAR